MQNTQYELLVGKLDEFIRKYYKNQLVRGGIYASAALLIFFLSIAALEYFGRFNSTVRTVLFYFFITGTGFILINWVIYPLSKLYKLGRIITYEQAAEIIGRHFSNVQDKLINVLQLQKHHSVSQSASLVSASIDQRIAELRPVPFASAIDLSQNRRYLPYAFIPLSIFIIILFSAPGIITESTKRLVEHSTYFEPPAPFKFIIENENLQGIQQEDFDLKLKMEGNEIPQDVYIEVDKTQFKLEKENTIKFNYTFKNLQRDTKFRLYANGFYSKEYTLETLPNPMVLDFQIELEYPRYTGRRNEVVENSGDLLIPAGTKVKWLFNTRNSKAVKMAFDDTTYSIGQDRPDQYSFSSRFLKNNNYTVITSNEFLKSKDSIQYAINVVPDLFPSVETDQKQDSLENKRVYFNGSVSDDYGLTRLTFIYRHISDDSSSAFSQNIPLNGQNKQVFFHHFDFSQISLNPGDNVEYYFEVWDNDGVHGSKSSRTQKMVFKAPTLDEISKTAEKNNQDIKSSLESSITEAKKIQKELYDLNKKMIDKQNPGWEEKKRLEELLNRQKELQKKIENTHRKTEQNFDRQNEFKQQNEQLLEKQQQLEELMKEVLTEEMKKLIEELEKLMDKMNKEQMQDKLDEMKLSNKDIEKELDRSLELFKQLEVEQKLQESIDKLKDLSEKQEKLSEKSLEKNADSKELKQQQDELNKKFDEVKKDLDELEKKNSELEEPNKMESTEEQEKAAEEQMKKSSEELNQGKNKKASESQKGAAEKMQEMSQKLEQAQQENQEQQSEEDMNALRDILENLLKLSFDQESTMEQIKKTDKNNPQYVKLSQNQKKLKDDAKMIEDSLLALSKRVPELDAMVNREISGINMNMDKALEHLGERQTPPATSRQQMVMTSVNNLALMLSEALQQMQQQMQQQKQGNQSCSKPGKGSPKQSAASMRKMQEQINQQIKKMKGEMEKNGGPPKAGQQGPGGKTGKQMSEELARLAAQQEAIRNQLQKLSEELGKDGGNKGSGGNLDKMGKKMEETETDLVNKRITQETIKRQEEILTRLLEAEKAEKEREMDEKRQSNENKNELFSNPSQFLEYKRLKEKEAELLKTVPASLSPFYKNKVNDYFNKLEE